MGPYEFRVLLALVPQSVNIIKKTNGEQGAESVRDIIIWRL